MKSTQDVASATALPAQQYKVPTSARREQSEIDYGEAKRGGKLIPLNEEACIRMYKYWKLIDNRFPYDMIFKTHHMLIPHRVIANEEDLYPRERYELKQIIDEYRGIYDLMFENFPARRSILSHYHLHFAKYHDDRADFKL